MHRVGKPHFHAFEGWNKAADLRGHSGKKIDIQEITPYSNLLKDTELANGRYSSHKRERLHPETGT